MLLLRRSVGVECRGVASQGPAEMCWRVLSLSSVAEECCREALEKKSSVSVEEPCREVLEDMNVEQCWRI